MIKKNQRRETKTPKFLFGVFFNPDCLFVWYSSQLQQRRGHVKKRGAESRVQTKAFQCFMKRLPMLQIELQFFCAVRGPELDSKIKTAAGSEFSIKCETLGYSGLASV